MRPNPSTTCTLAGPRPHKLPPGVGEAQLKPRLLRTIEEAYGDGFRTFLCGGAMGVDIWAGECVLALRERLPGLRLAVVMPHPGQAEHWPAGWRARHRALCERADAVYVFEGAYSKGCMLRRNRFMLARSGRLIAVYDGHSGGGTAHAIACARRLQVPVVEVPPI